MILKTFKVQLKWNRNSRVLKKLTDDKNLLLISFFLYFFIMFPLKSTAAFFQNPNGLACHHIYLNKNTAFKESPLTIQSKRQNWI